ncbi:hypothetical protein AB0K62_24530 [Streptomyces halstedii]|uniref:8-oxoguanine DNA glycosylase OGG fold protein n=1 Tax=Streptomyces halstedii TaxID=1944 RepID=UPI0034610D84
MEQLRRLVEAHAGRGQEGVRFRPETWRPWLEPHGAAHVLDAGWERATGPGADRLIDRDGLTAVRARAGDDRDGLRDLFVAVMIWGSGTTNGRGPRHTAAALSDPRLPAVLRATRDSVREGDLGLAYSQFTVRGVGRSFFTKWFAAVDDRASECDRALILDDRVFRSLNALGWSSREAAGTRRRPTRYATYVSTMHGWARELGTTADRLEWILFAVNGQVDGKGWSPTWARIRGADERTG